MRYVILATLMLCALTASAQQANRDAFLADEITANDLAGYCATVPVSKAHTVSEGICVGYLTATVHMMVWTNAGDLCAAPVDPRLLAAMYMSYIADHPEQRKSPAIKAASLAVVHAYTCTN